MIDTERGTNHYGKIFDFDVSYTANFGDVDKAVDALLKDSMGYKTLVIDPFSNIWDRMIENHQTFLRKKKGNPTYEITGLDYRPLKSALKKFVGKLNDLDMNVVMTAKSKTIYSSDAGDFMKPIGTVPDGHKDLPGMFDVVIEILVDQLTGKRTAKVYKDRTNSLPREFEFTYEIMAGYFGIDDLERESVSFDPAYKNMSGRNTIIEHDGENIQTAGVTSDQLVKLEIIMKKEDQDSVMEKLQGDFGVASFLDLRKDEAELFIKDITTKKEK